MSKHKNTYRTQAHALLLHDFHRTLAHDARGAVATPYDPAGEERTLVACVAEQLSGEQDLQTLGDLLRIAAHASKRGDAWATSVLCRLAQAHASYYTSMMQEYGDLDDSRCDP